MSLRGLLASRWKRRSGRTVVTIGYPSHGKTVFLAGMFWDSFFALSESMQDERTPYAVRAANAKASETFFGNAISLSRLDLPPSSPRTTPEPAVLEFQGIPAVGRKERRSLRLTFYDVAGELVSDEAWLTKHATFLPEADDIVFMFDPTRTDFSARALQAADLFDRIRRLIPGVEKKHVLVVLSKLDELRYESEWAETIADLWPEASPSPTSLAHYFQEMEALSRNVRCWWVQPSHGGRGFVNRVPASARFCAISSLGQQPVWTCPTCDLPQEDSRRQCAGCGGERPRGVRLRLPDRPQPFRVRDPLFWIFRTAGVM